MEAIWANKLRSLLTVLGNIVAVTSIITVVSLIQGMNGYVTNAIVSDLGADSFNVERTGIIRSDEEADRVRNNPLITLDDADAIRRFSPVVEAVMAQARRNSGSGLSRHVARLGAGSRGDPRVFAILDVRRRARQAVESD